MKLCRRMLVDKSDYTSTGYAAKRRLGTDDPVTITRELDTRLAEVCRNVKAKDIKIFTLLFDPVGRTTDSNVQNLLSSCATSTSKHGYKAYSQAELVQAFQTIANCRPAARSEMQTAASPGRDRRRRAAARGRATPRCKDRRRR